LWKTAQKLTNSSAPADGRYRLLVSFPAILKNQIAAVRNGLTCLTFLFILSFSVQG
jgi:hypothetical protein